MTLFRSSFLTLIATSIKMLVALLINKVAAVYLGPSGISLIAQFQNFVQISSTLGQGAAATGVTKYVAERERDKGVREIVGTAVAFSLICSLPLAALIVLFAESLSERLFESSGLIHILYIFSALLPLFSLNAIFLAVINGLQKIKDWVAINILQSLLALVLTIILMRQMGLEGALLSLALLQALMFFISLSIIKIKKLIQLHYFFPSMHSKELRLLGRFSLMGLVGLISGPLVLIFIRDHLAETNGWDTAGIWQGLQSISTLYLTVITTSIVVYYLPKLSSTLKDDDLLYEILSALKLGFIFSLFAASMIYILRIEIIGLLFSDDFLDMGELFFWQLVGDILRVSSWFFAYVFVAKAKVKTHLSLEIFSALIFVSLSFLFVSDLGIQGVPIAYALTNALYFFTVLALFISYFKSGLLRG